MLDGCPSQAPTLIAVDHGRGGDDGDEEEETDEANFEKDGLTSRAVQGKDKEEGGVGR